MPGECKECLEWTGLDGSGWEWMGNERTGEERNGFMPGECKECWEHTLDCQCKDRIEFAMAALNMALIQFSNLGFEIPKEFEFKKKKNDKEKVLQKKP